MAIRKISLNLRTNESVQYLNFDYFKKRNIEINKDWILKRKQIILKLISNFENKLNQLNKNLQERLKKELNKLHCKRLKQYDYLMTKYLRCKNLLEEINAKEQLLFSKNKKMFEIRNDIPKIGIEREESPVRERKKRKFIFDESDSKEIIDPNHINLSDTIRSKAVAETLNSIAQSVITQVEKNFVRRNTLDEVVRNTKGIMEEPSDLDFSVYSDN